MIALAWACGLRREEIASLTVASLKQTDPGEGDLIIKGKGNKTRAAYIYNGAFAAVIAWLGVRGDKAGPLFVTINKAGKITGQRLSGEALRLILDKRAQQAQLTEAMTWHDFRRSFAGNLLDSGADLVTVQKLMGHKSPITTSNYDRRGDETKRKAVKALFVPYTGKR